MIKKLVLYIYTLSYLKPIQLYWRLVLKCQQVFPLSVLIREPISIRKLQFKQFIVKNTSLVNGEFRFLNQSYLSALPISWNDSEMNKLWLYNLHYFDFLNQEKIKPQSALEIIRDWIKKNDIGSGNGWESYPLSLRIVNWIKFISAVDLVPDQASTIHNSLYLQARFLRKHIEYHLLGNHLFKNCVALMFAGVYFDSKESNEWLQTGKKIFLRQVDEQVLDDGGHFERSPMYHAIFLEDILDSLNLIGTNNIKYDEFDRLGRLVENMCRFLADILHQDREFPLFNDCALGIAPKPDLLFDYVNRLGILANQEQLAEKLYKDANRLSVVYKKEFGLFVLDNGASRLIMDVGMIGPDYLSGHAHCDTLSYELSLFGDRCIVNSGTYQYAGDMRNYFRSTQSHNTVQIDNEEQHEIWSTFRVARRGRPFDHLIEQDAQSIKISASHSGYERLPGRPVHRRTVILKDQTYIINDLIDGKGVHHVISHIHLHPNVNIKSFNKSEVICYINDCMFIVRAISDIGFETKDGWYSDEFGKKRLNKVLCLEAKGRCPISANYSIEYSRQ